MILVLNKLLGVIIMFFYLQLFLFYSGKLDTKNREDFLLDGLENFIVMMISAF